MELFALPTVYFFLRILRPVPGRGVELAIFLSVEPSTMPNLPGNLVRRGQVRHVRQPAVPFGRPQNVIQSNELVRDRGTRRGATCGRCLDAVHPVLDASRLSDLRDGFPFEEGHQVHPDAEFQVLDVLRAALPTRHHLELSLKDFRDLFKQLSGPQLADFELPTEAQIPVFGEIDGLLQALLFGRFPPVLAGQEGRDLPIRAARAFVELHFAAKERVLGHLSSCVTVCDSVCKLCVTLPRLGLTVNFFVERLILN